MAFKYIVKPGDTLNDISQRYGFTNYKTAGITSVPSGNFDLIRPGEEITIGNYDPNKIQTIQQGSPVVSSSDNAQMYRENSNKLDGILSGISSAVGINKGTSTEKDTTKTEKYTPFATGEENKDGVKETTGDPIRDKLNTWENEQQAKYEADVAAKKVEYANLYNTSLASVDATANATIQKINSTFDKRVSEQQRINKLNIDRVKAYGLSEGGRFVPIVFQDAITLREQEAADKVTELDSQRNALIAEAKSARDIGASKLLREKLEDLDKIDQELRKQLQEVEKEAEAQYKLLRDLRKEEETKHLEAVTKMKERLSAIAPKYKDQYEGMTPEEKDAFITKLAEQTGLDYATIYSTLEGAVYSADEKALDLKKKEADIRGTEALAKQREADAAKTFADAATGDKTKKTVADMQKDIPTKISTKEEGNKLRMEFVKKYGVEGAKYWDAIYKDEVGDYVYGTDTTNDVNKEAETAKNAKIGEVVTIKGKKYKKVAEDNFEEIE